VSDGGDAVDLDVETADGTLMKMRAGKSFGK
jgi:hypothetical protein